MLDANTPTAAAIGNLKINNAIPLIVSIAKPSINLSNDLIIKPGRLTPPPPLR